MSVLSLVLMVFLVIFQPSPIRVMSVVYVLKVFALAFLWLQFAWLKVLPQDMSHYFNISCVCLGVIDVGSVVLLMKVFCYVM